MRPTQPGGGAADLLSHPTTAGGNSGLGLQLARQGHHRRHRASALHGTPATLPATWPPASLPNIFGRISAALNSHVVPRHTYGYSNPMGFQTSDFRLLWTIPPNPQHPSPP